MLDASEIRLDVIQFRTVGRQEVQRNPLIPQLRQGLLHFLRAVAGGIVQRRHPGLDNALGAVGGAENRVHLHFSR